MNEQIDDTADTAVPTAVIAEEPAAATPEFRMELNLFLRPAATPVDLSHWQCRDNGPAMALADDATGVAVKLTLNRSSAAFLMRLCEGTGAGAGAGVNALLALAYAIDHAEDERAGLVAAVRNMIVHLDDGRRAAAGGGEATLPG